MAGERELKLTLLGDAKSALRAIRQQEGGLKRLTGATRAAGKAMLVGGGIAGVALAGVGIAATKMGLDFEKAFAEVQTLLPDLNKEGIGVLRKGVLDLSRELGVATSDAVPALYQAISAGVPPSNVLDFMRTATAASIGGVTSLSTAVDGISTVINTYGKETISAGRASDLMFTAVKLGKTTFGELSASLSNVLPIAQAAGVNFETVAGALAALTAKGVPTAQATTQLRAAIQSLAAPTVRQAKLLNELGVENLAAVIKNEGLAAAMQKVQEAAGGDLAVMRKLLGSVEAVGAVLSLSGENADAFTGVLDQMSEAAGATDTAMKVMADTAGFKLNKAINEIKVLMTELGLQILPFVARAISEVLLPAIDRFRAWVVENRERIREFFTRVQVVAVALFDHIRAGLATVLPLLATFAKWVYSNKPLLIVAFTAIGVAIALALGPVSLAAVAIVAFITLIGFFRNKWREIGNAVIGAVETMANGIISAMFDLARGFLIPIQVMIDGLNKFGLRIPSVVDALDGLRDKVEVTFPRIADAVRDFTVVTGAHFEEMAFGVSTVGTAIDEVAVAVPPAIAAIESVATTMTTKGVPAADKLAAALAGVAAREREMARGFRGNQVAAIEEHGVGAFGFNVQRRLAGGQGIGIGGIARDFAGAEMKVRRSAGRAGIGATAIESLVTQLRAQARLQGVTINVTQPLGTTAEVAEAVLGAVVQLERTGKMRTVTA